MSGALMSILATPGNATPPPPSLSVSLNGKSNNVSGQTGSVNGFTTSVSGGTPPYSFSFQSRSNGPLSSTSAQINYNIPSSAIGNQYSIGQRVTVTDSSNPQQSATSNDATAYVTRTS